MCKYLGVNHTILVNNCTSALHLALMILGIKSGNVLVPDYTFTSTGLAPILVNASPKLVDVEYDTANIEVNQIERSIDSNTKCIIPVHYAGHPCEMDSINRIANENEIFVVEDAAQALGSEYKGRKAGTLSDIGCFSFHAVKNITCGEGGAIVTNDDKLAEKAVIMRDKGTNKAAFNIHQNTGFYDYVSEGHNFMLSEILAAVALEQFKKIDKITELRRKNADYMVKELKKLNNPKIILPTVKNYANTNWHLFPIKFKGDVNWFSKAMNAEGITANIHYVPLHLTTLYKKYGYKEGDFPNAERVFNSMVRLPMHPGLTKEDMDNIVKAVEKVAR